MFNLYYLYKLSIITNTRLFLYFMFPIFYNFININKIMFVSYLYKNILSRNYIKLRIVSIFKINRFTLNI